MIRQMNVGSALYLTITGRLWCSIGIAWFTALTVAASFLERNQSMTGQPAPDVFKRCLICKDIMPGILIIQGLLAPRQICYHCECFYSDKGDNAA